MFDTRLVCRKPRLAAGCVVASADVISVDSVSADAVAVSAASVTRCLGRFMVVLTEDSGAAADMALLAHGFALYHLVKQDRRTPVVTSLRDRVFNRRPSLRCRRSCREIHPALQGALLLWCRVALCGRYLTVIEIPISHRRRVAGLNVPIDEGLSSSSCRSGIERTTSTIRDSSHGECNAVRMPARTQHDLCS